MLHLEVLGIKYLKMRNETHLHKRKTPNKPKPNISKPSTKTQTYAHRHKPPKRNIQINPSIKKPTNQKLTKNPQQKTKPNPLHTDQKNHYTINQ